MKTEEMRYRFSAQSQQIFPVHIEGRVTIIRFSERNQFGNSVFFTADRKVAEAIRRMSMFQRGAIQEVTSEEELKVLEGLYQVQLENAGETVDTPATGGEAQKKAEAATASDAEEKDMFFANFTQAKEWLCKEYGIAKTKIRKPETVAEIAKENGIIIHYTEEDY